MVDVSTGGGTPRNWTSARAGHDVLLAAQRPAPGQASCRLPLQAPEVGSRRCEPPMLAMPARRSTASNERRLPRAAETPSCSPSSRYLPRQAWHVICDLACAVSSAGLLILIPEGGLRQTALAGQFCPAGLLILIPEVPDADQMQHLLEATKVACPW